MNKSRRGLLAVALVLAIGLLGVSIWYPPQGRQEAQGAIGTVQKHRTSQISAKDVVLGDEQARNEEKIVYGLYFDDAIKLESLSADLAAFADSLENKNLENVKAELQSLSKSLESYSADLRQRTNGQITDTIAAIDRLEARGDSLGAGKADLVNGIKAELLGLQKSLDAREALDAKQITYSGDNRIKGLDSKVLESMEADLAAVVKGLENRDSLDNTQLGVLNADLQNVQKSLEARTDLGIRDLANHVDALQAFALEQKTLDAAQIQLGRVNETVTNLGLTYRFGHGSREQSELNAISADLASRSAELQNRAVENMQSRFETNLGAAERLENMESMAESMSKGLENRDMLGLQQIQQTLNGVRDDLENRSTDLSNRSLGSMQAELAAISEHLDNRAGLEAKLLESLGSKSLGSLSDYLGQVSAALESRNADLGQRADALQSRAEDMANRSGLESRDNN